MPYARLLASFIVVLACTVAAAGEGNEPDPAAPGSAAHAPKPVNVPATFGSSDIRSWYAPDSRTLVVDTYAHGKFKATLGSPCHGLRYAETIGFSTLGPYELDASTTVTLPDGQRCMFTELRPYSDQDEQRDREMRGTSPPPPAAGPHD